MPDRSPVVALISAVPTAIVPARAAFGAFFPSATVWNLLDDRLLTDAAQQGGVGPELVARMHRLIDHAILGGADAVLLTCSMYSAAAQEKSLATSIPVLGPDEALFEEAATGGYRRVAVVSSSADALADSVSRIRCVTAADVAVSGVVAEGAAAAARAGDMAALTAAVVEALADAVTDCDAVVLGQYSLAPAAVGVAAAVGLPTLSGPELAVRTLQHRLGVAAA